MTSKIDELKDKIFELECERDELQILLDTMEYSGWSEFEEAMKKVVQELQETNCWIVYYKQLLKEIEDREKYDE